MLMNAGKTYKLVDQVREKVRLAEGIDTNGEIHKDPMRRAVETLTMFRRLCDASKVDRIIAVATSATRDAKNQAEFLRLVKKNARIDLRVISGEQEAVLWLSGYDQYVSISGLLSV